MRQVCRLDDAGTDRKKETRIKHHVLQSCCAGLSLRLGPIAWARRFYALLGFLVRWGSSCPQAPGSSVSSEGVLASLPTESVAGPLHPQPRLLTNRNPMTRMTTTTFSSLSSASSVSAGLDWKSSRPPQRPTRAETPQGCWSAPPRPAPILPAGGTLCRTDEPRGLQPDAPCGGGCCSPAKT